MFHPIISPQRFYYKAFNIKEHLKKLNLFKIYEFKKNKKDLKMSF